MSCPPRPLALLAGTAVLSTLALPTAALAAPEGSALLDESAIAPHAAVYGYYVDEWDTNTSEQLDPASNAAVGVLDGMLEIWQPGETWDSGVSLQPEVTDSNIAQSIEISSAATDAEQERAYVIDRRHQNYTATEGLGPYTEAYRESVNAGTTISDRVPADASTVKHSDESNENGAWADADGELGATVQLVDDIRNHAATSNNAKFSYQYPRPYRWSDEVDMPSYADPLRKPVEEAAEDGGFPSGHTSAGYMAVYGLAHSFPQQYDELLLTAQEIGTSRIQLGMHSPLDVMGGRMLSTAITAGALYDEDLEAVKDEAYEEGQAWLAEQVSEGAGSDVQDAEQLVDPDYDAELASYTASLTYGFEQTGDTGEAMRVPKGAEVLLETRFPYLDDEQLRWVLHSTGLESGYPLLDDEEGWGRLNLYAAQGGYGSFDTDVVVRMSSADGGYSAADAWQNDIDGAGSLTLRGDGELILAGENSFTGGTVVEGGTLRAATSSALGAGDVAVDGGALAVDGELDIDGDLGLAADGALDLAVGSADGQGAILRVGGAASLDGTVRVSLPEGADLAQDIVLVSAASMSADAAPLRLEVDGLAEGVDAELEVRDGQLVLTAAGAETPADGDGTDSGTGEQTGEEPAEQPTDGEQTDGEQAGGAPQDDSADGGSSDGGPSSEGAPTASDPSASDSSDAGSSDAGSSGPDSAAREEDQPSGTTQAGNAAGSQGVLARTGFPALALASAGGLLIAAGVGTTILVRRRG